MLDWDCLACRKPWPCDPAREELPATHDAVQLRITMWGVLEEAVHILPPTPALEEAVHILPPTPAAELFQRFLHWTGRRVAG
jgi:hypothetical protein